MIQNLSTQIETYNPFLIDIFRRIKIVALSFVAFFIVGFFASSPIIRFFLAHFHFENVSLNTTSPFQLFDLALDLAMFIAFLCTVPILIYQIYGFIRSALHSDERKIFFLILPLSCFLFLLGFGYGFLILYSTIQVLADVNMHLGIKNVWDISLFLSNIVSTSALLGLIFQFPIILSLLIRLKVMHVAYLKEKRRVAILMMCIFTSLLPPTDGISLLLMVLPLVVMYEITIAYNRFVN